MWSRGSIGLEFLNVVLEGRHEFVITRNKGKSN
jgi:hypothetical protein